MKILIIGPSWIGDMVMSQSLYITLKKMYPNAQIDVLAPIWCSPILKRMPEVNRVLEMSIGHGSLNLLGRWQLAQVLVNENYTHAYILPNSIKSALIPFFARIGHRIGWKGEYRYGLLTDLRSKKQIFNYMVERYVALTCSKSTMREQVDIHTCPKPKLQIDRVVQQEIQKQLGLVDYRPVVGLCPGAEFGASKRWPDRYYARVAAELIDEGEQIWLFGSDKDREVAEKIRNALSAEQQKHCFNLAGSTQLAEVVDLLNVCHTVICNDSGLMHIAAAVGCNVVAIYGSSSPRYTPPLTDALKIVHADVACSPCFKRECPLKHLSCLNQLLPEQVLSAFKELKASQN